MRLLSAICLVLIWGLSPETALAQTVSVSDLEAGPESYDAQTVTVRGELVGDYGARAEGIWVQLNDDPYVEGPLAETGRLRGGNVGLGVRLSPESLELLNRHPPGGYGRRGPIVEVTGSFRYHDPALGGETYLQAASLTVVEPARPLEVPVRRWPFVAGVVLLAVSGLLGIRVRRSPRPS